MLKEFVKGHVARELLQRAKYLNLKKLKNIIAFYKENPPVKRGEV